MSKIVVIGSSNTDMLIQVPRIPKPGETILGGEFTTAAGGKGANQAVAAARAGGDVALIAKVGDDIYGQQALLGFEQDNINTDFVSKDKTLPSGVALIFVGDDGENSIAVASGANANLTEQDVQAASQLINNADIALMQLETPLATIRHAASVAKDNGVKVILNPAPAPSAPLPDDLLATLSMITPNETEAEILTGIKVIDQNTAEQAASVLISKGLETVIITLGKKGALLKTAELCRLIPSYKVDAIDSTAAGDVFNGALTVAISEGQSIEKAIKFANAAAALSVTKLGAQPSVHKRVEIDSFLNEWSG